MIKKVLSIAGSDCSGGAGVQADIKTMSALGVYAMSVITSVVAENTVGVISSCDVPASVIGDQLRAVLEDIGADAVKVGMLPSRECMHAVADKLKGYGGHVIVDPVMCAKDGTFLMKEDAVETFVREIVPLATMLTPNIPEAERLAGMKIESLSDMETAAKRICDLGARTVLVKGGHYGGDPCDVLWNGKAVRFESARIDTKNTHGTGCTLSSAIAAFAARGFSYEQAVGRAKEYITGAIANSLSIGHGHGPLGHFYEFYRPKKREIDYSLYLCTDRNIIDRPLEECVAEAADGGVTVVQLREKNCSSREFYDLGCKIRAITAVKGVPLIINDRVDIALAVGADGVHLGQSDLSCKTVRRLVGDSMIIGVTAHNREEALKAELDGADYIGVGAMFSTSTKRDAKVIKEGELEAIRSAVKIPMVLIGGINRENVASLRGKGDGIAVVSAILGSGDIKRAAKELRKLWK